VQPYDEIIIIIIIIIIIAVVVVVVVVVVVLFLVMESQWKEIDGGRPKYSRKTCPTATLSITNPTWTDPGSKPGLLAGRPAANRLSRDTTLNRKLHQNRTFFMNIPLLFYIFVINHLKTEITLNYMLQAKFVPRSKHSVSVLKINQLMLHRKIIFFVRDPYKTCK
jgi:hypothetical protein